jgi:hypothetical protein
MMRRGKNFAPVRRHPALLWRRAAPGVFSFGPGFSSEVTSVAPHPLISPPTMLIPRILRPRRLLAVLGFVSYVLALPSSGLAQGCVIARGGGGVCMLDDDTLLAAKRWQMTFAFRWFESHRHFAGSVEHTHRDRDGTEVINDSYFYDATATYAWSERVNLSFTVPFVYHDRSSLYEHLGNSSGRRFSTQASGLGDLRASASYWLFNPSDTHRGNLSLGLGLKAPTGDYKVQDTFIRPAGPTRRYVDSSIQPGDGGWGYTVELQGFLRLKGNLVAYGNAFYLFNPEGRVEATGFSIPDAYMARGGFDYSVPFVHGLSVSLGGRIEGVPGHDAFGNSRGSRRPGFAVAVEPGVSFAKGRFSGALTVPVAVHRNRTTTFGSSRAGDAAFADFTINTSLSYRL